MTDLSKLLREMAVQRETVTPDEHGVRILSAILNRNKRLMAEAADALDARWQTMESAPRDEGWVLVGRHRPDGTFQPALSFRPRQYSFGEFDDIPPTHWQPLPPPPEDV